MRGAEAGQPGDVLLFSGSDCAVHRQKQDQLRDLRLQRLRIPGAHPFFPTKPHLKLRSRVPFSSCPCSGLAFVSSWRRSCHTTTCPQRAPCTTPQRCYSSPGFRSHPSHQPTSNPDKRWLREESSEECGNSDGSLSSAPQCWENSVGEELYKLIIFNFLLTVAFAFLVTLPRR